MANWDDYRVFLEVARKGSLTAAAPALKLDPATVGRRIARLEGALSTSLFTKQQQGYVLNAAGSDLLEHITKIEATERAARGIARTDGSDLHGTVRIGAPDGLANFILPQVCQRIAASNPDLRLEILSLPRVANLSQREVDIALMVTPPTVGRFLTQKVTDYRLHLAAHSDYLSGHPPITERADIKQHRLIGYIPDLIFDAGLDFSAEVAPRRTPDLASNSVSVQMNLVRNAAGIGIVHDFAIPDFPGVKRILSKEISLRRAYHSVRQKEDRPDQLGKVNTLLVAEIKSEIARRQSWVDENA